MQIDIALHDLAMEYVKKHISSTSTPEQVWDLYFEASKRLRDAAAQTRKTAPRRID